ncbi:MAG: hypothetical protein ACR2F6_09235 [Mycobacteriales bacterium]
MSESSVRAIERLIFTAESPDEVRDWLDLHLRARLGAEIEALTFRAGDIGAVFGLRLLDGREVVLKALRPGAELRRLRAVVSAQNRLAVAGFACPVVLDGPSSTNGVLAVVEQAMGCTSTGSPHDSAARAAMAGGLAAQIEALRGVDGSALITGRPAWANWDRGPGLSRTTRYSTSPSPSTVSNGSTGPPTARRDSCGKPVTVLR